MILKPPCPVQDLQAISKECSRLAPVSSSLRLKVFTFLFNERSSIPFVSQESKKAVFINLCPFLWRVCVSVWNYNILNLMPESSYFTFRTTYINIILTHKLTLQQLFSTVLGYMKEYLYVNLMVFFLFLLISSNFYYLILVEVCWGFRLWMKLDQHCIHWWASIIVLFDVQVVLLESSCKLYCHV